MNFYPLRWLSQGIFCSFSACFLVLTEKTIYLRFIFLFLTMKKIVKPLLIAVLLVIGQAVWAQSANPMQVAMQNGQTTTVQVTEFYDAISVGANGIGNFYGSLTLAAPEGYLMAASGTLGGHLGNLNLTYSCDGDSQQEFHVADENISFGQPQIITRGNCLTFSVNGTDFTMTAYVVVYNPNKVSTEALLRFFMDHGEGTQHLKLSDDIELSDFVNIGNGKSIEIDLNGHSLSRNLDEANDNGHVFHVSAEGALTIKDSNAEQEGTVTGGRAIQGGAVFNLGRFVMEGGSLTGNQAREGGAIFNAPSGTCVISGNSFISGNLATNHGGAIYDLGTLQMKGEIQIKNNDGDDVYLPNDQKINVISPVYSGENSIGISMQYPGRCTVGYGTFDTGTNPFFAPGTAPNKVVVYEGECYWCYGYIECSWDSENQQLVQTLKTIPADNTVVNICSITSSGDLWGNDYWFIADGTGTNEGSLICRDEVHIILLDGASMTINQGLYVNSGATLHIYSQSYGDQMGKLISQNDSSSQPGIGCRRQEPTMGVLDIHGGNITAKGGSSGAGIGGCEDANSGEIRIWGGNITANGGKKAAGIGGGNGGSATATYIYGGNVTAKGGEYAAGIGGGKKSGGGGNGGLVHIYGGVVDATGSDSEGWLTQSSGAGIGSGSEGTQTGPICIYGGEVNAKGGTFAAGIGGGDHSIGGFITITGGDVTAIGGQFGAGIGAGGYKTSTSNIGLIEISGGVVMAYSMHKSGYSYPSHGAGIGGGSRTTSGTIHINGGTIFAYSEDGAGIGGGYKGNSDNISIEGGSVAAISAVGGAGIGGGCAGTSNSHENGHCNVVTIRNCEVLALGGCQEIVFQDGNTYKPLKVFLLVLKDMAKKAKYFESYKEMVTEGLSSLLELLRPEEDKYGGAGIGGGLRGNGGTVDIMNSTVTVMSGHAEYPAIGRGYKGESNGTLSLDPASMVMAGEEEDEVEIQLKDNKSSACQSDDYQYVKIEKCGHADADVYEDYGNGTYLAEGCRYCSLIGSEVLPHTFFLEGDWNDEEQWKSGHVPNPGNSVIIDDNCFIPRNYLAIANNITCNYGDTIIIESRGQLIHNNNEVVAVVKKFVEAYTNDDDGWYFITFPFNEDIEPNAQMLSANYDLYSFNQVGNANGKEWINYKANPRDFKLVNGEGYLYARNENLMIELAGTLNATQGTVPLDYAEEASFSGWNLIGNPFPCNTTIDRPFYVINGRNVVANTGSSIIPPYTGVMVKANSVGETVTFSKTTEPIPSREGRLQITIPETDNAIITFRQDGGELEKFDFNSNLSKVYVPKDGKDYAVVATEAQGEMPLNFKASRNGTYTISVESEDMEMDYLHLVDNMTGANVDLLQTPNYTFEAKTSDYESRFRLVFSGHADDPSEPTSFAHYANGEIRLLETSYGTSLQIVDMMGCVIFSRDDVNIVSTGGMAPGVYFLRLVKGNDVKTQKMAIY